MASTLPSTSDCCTPCDGTVEVAVPGSKGDAGTNGTNGADGTNAFTTTTASFIMPDEGENVTVTVLNSSWAVVGQNVFVQTAGTMQVVSKPDATSVELQNLEDTASGFYPANAAFTTEIASGVQIGPGGIQGASGSDAGSGAPSDAAYWVRTADGDLSNETDMSSLATGLVRNTTATGVPTIVTEGTADTNQAPVDQAAGMTSGRAVFATASGIETKTDTAAADAILPTTTKGDIIVHDGTNNIRLAVGSTNGEALVADSGEASGLKWGVPSAVFFQANRNGTDQSITNGSTQKIQFNNEEEDSGSYYDPTTNYRFTPLVAGIYKVTLHVTYTSAIAANSRFMAAIYKNGSQVAIGNNSGTTFDVTYPPFITVTQMVRLNGSTDYIEAYTKHDDTSSRDLLGGTDESWFEANKIGS